MQNKQEFLFDLIQKREKLYEKKKTKRTIIVILCFSIIFFCIFYFNFEVKGLDILYTILLSFFCGSIYFYINFIIFSVLYKYSIKEDLEIQGLKDKYYNTKNKDYMENNYNK